MATGAAIGGPAGTIIGAATGMIASDILTKDDD